MLRVSLLASACLLAATPVFAQSQEVRRGPVPAWAMTSPLMAVPESVSGPVFIRRQDTSIHLDDQGQAQYLGYRMKILQSSALQLGNIAIVWNPAAGAPIVHGITLVRDGEATDVLKTASFEILRREDQLEAAKLDGRLTAVLRVPDLRVGDELEVELTTFGGDPTLGHNESGLLLLTPAPMKGRYRLGLSWDEGHKPKLQMTPDMAAVAQESERAIDFRFDNPPLLSPPKDAPARYQWQRAVEYSDFADWAAVSRHFAPLYAKAATLPADSAIKREAARIAAAHPRPLDRAGAALKPVQQDVRYVYVGLDGGNLTPATAEETWQRRYGDCKGKTALLLALLAELGVEAQAVVVNIDGVDDGFDQRLAMPQLFNHVLVRARIDGESYWLDGTLPAVATPSERPVYPIGWALPLTAQGAGLEKLEWRPADKPEEINLVEIDARAGFDKPARITTTQIVRGLPGLAQQVQFSTVTADQLREAYRQRAIGDTFQTIDDVQWRYDQKAGASILIITGEGAAGWEDRGGAAKSLALPGGGFSPPQRRVRSADQDASAPFYTEPEYICSVTTVRLPASTEAKQWSSAASYDTRLFGRHYHRAWELRDGTIRMVSGSRVEQTEIDAAAARQDNDRIAAFDNSMGWISYNPRQGKASVGRGESVPSTYDIDWTASDAPCAGAPKA
jgi:transglutaminase-like putative cysteine protease